MNSHPKQNLAIDPEIFPNAAELADADTESQGNPAGFHVENRNGNIVVVDTLGNVVASLTKGKKLSYESGIQAKFQQKRLDAIKAKQAKSK